VEPAVQETRTEQTHRQQTVGLAVVALAELVPEAQRMAVMVQAVL
jgi:hypothetical protein